ncbi:oxidoreductase [Williamsia herbipolensis]|uniref:Oxidoreductase n=1 Tax=Williamsia herbipolensis TaxID=1603258 RepID=A0AAU4K494_9NOCA|nr:oxidoreductase [Williamsia herbipolensis]
MPSHGTPPNALRDPTVLITGANSGIGRATAQAVASRGSRVVLAVRNRAAGDAVVDELVGGRDRHVVAQLDLADLDSVRRFADQWTEPIDVLVNNAGVATPRLLRTADGFEMQFGTNHLGHFALTALLLPLVSSRVVTVASQAERAGRLDLDDLNWSRRPFRNSRAYADSKLANVLFTQELTRRLTASRSPVTAYSAHPGLVRTAIYDRPPGTTPTIWDRLVPILGQDPDAGALPVLLAIFGDIAPGSFTGPRHFANMRGGAHVIGLSKQARDHQLAAGLWAASERLTSTQVPA